MVFTNELKHKLVLRNQFLFYRALNYASLIGIWPFYLILLFQQTNSIVALMLEGLIFFIALYIGFLLGSFWLDSNGYLSTFRLSFLIEGFVYFLLILVINNLSTFYILIAIFRGLGRGIFLPTFHSYSLKEMHGFKRGTFINIVESMTLLIYILVPFIAGTSIALYEGYILLFLVAGSIYFFATVYPWQYNKHPRSKIRLEEFNRIIKKKNFAKFALISGVFYSSQSFFDFVFSFIPFIIIGTEFGVGVLTSFAGIAAALASFLERKSKLSTKIAFGYFGFILFAVLTGSLSIFFWTIWMLAIRNIGVAFTQSLSDAIQRDLDYRIREKILGDFQNESASEMDIIIETINVICRIASFTIVIIVLTLFSFEVSEQILRIIMLVFSIVPFIGYFGYVWLNRKIKLI